MKTCRLCREAKPLANFTSHKLTRDGYRSECRSCLAVVHREWRQRNFERVNAAHRRFYLRQYGLTQEMHDEMLRAQGGACAICGATDPGLGNGGRRRNFSVDHDHVTGRVRGLLCNRCNRFIGLMNDDPILLARAAAYLQAGGFD